MMPLGQSTPRKLNMGLVHEVMSAVWGCGLCAGARVLRKVRLDEKWGCFQLIVL